jgi:XTP/dITP diphosphohydrolase
MNEFKKILNKNQIVIASNNQGKIKEFDKLFLQYGIQIIAQSQLNISEPDEPYKSFIENALHKARHCSQFTDMPVIADDSGLCVAALNDEPGVYSRRYAGIDASDEDNNNKLINKLMHNNNRKAYYYCVLVLLKNNNDPTPIISEGRLDGEISYIPKIGSGFGYDPYFFLPNLNKNLSELSIEEKNKISHRAIAIKSMLNKLNDYFR